MSNGVFGDLFVVPALIYCIRVHCIVFDSDENNKNHFLVNTFIYTALICSLHINYFPTASRTTTMILLRNMVVAASSSLLLVLLSTPAVVEGTCECEKVCPGYIRYGIHSKDGGDGTSDGGYTDTCWMNRKQCLSGVSKKKVIAMIVMVVPFYFFIFLTAFFFVFFGNCRR